MATHVTLTLETPDVPIGTLREKIDRRPLAQGIRELWTLLKSVLLLVRRGYVRVNLATAVAEIEVTVSASGGAPTDTLVIGGVTLTNAASPANESEFADSATDAGLRNSVVACINAHTTLSKFVWAKVTAATKFKIYCKLPGEIGNHIPIAETGNGFTIGAAVLAGGAGDEMDEQQYGYDPAA